MASLELNGQYSPNEVCEWSFLEGWKEKLGELISSCSRKLGVNTFNNK